MPDHIIEIRLNERCTRAIHQAVCFTLDKWTGQEEIDQEMMLDPEGSGGMRPVDPTQLGATQGEPDAALRSMDVDAKATTMDANIVKPKGGEI